MKKMDKALKHLESKGFLANFQQKWEQNAMRKRTEELLAFWESGHSLGEAKAMFLAVR